MYALTKYAVKKTSPPPIPQLHYMNDSFHIFQVLLHRVALQCTGGHPSQLFHELATS